MTKPTPPGSSDETWHDTVAGSNTSSGEEAGKAKQASRVDPKLLELLACPVTKTSLDYDEAAQELISRAANLAFPIRDGIPIMLIDEARELDDG